VHRQRAQARTTSPGQQDGFHGQSDILAPSRYNAPERWLGTSRTP
jgi:hypothetical protein